METLTFLILIFAGLVFGLAILAVWSPRKPWVKFLSIALLSATIVIGYVGLADLLSRPKPISLEWVRASAKEAVVLGGVIKENEGIYLLLELPEFPEPRYYKLPWSRDLAEQFQEAMRESRRSGVPTRLRDPFEPSWDDREKKFYAPPQPAAPPKEQQRNTPQLFEDLEKENKNRQL